MSVVARNFLLLYGVSPKRYDSYIATALEIVQQGWDAYSRDDLDGVVAVLDPEIVWDVTHFEGWPEDQIYSGHEGSRRFMSEWRLAWDDYDVRVDKWIDNGDRVLSLSTLRGSGAGSQVPVELALAQIATVRDGRVIRLEIWSDCSAAMQSLATP